MRGQCKGYMTKKKGECVCEWQRHRHRRRQTECAYVRSRREHVTLLCLSLSRARSLSLCNCRIFAGAFEGATLYSNVDYVRYACQKSPEKNPKNSPATLKRDLLT